MNLHQYVFGETDPHQHQEGLPSSFSALTSTGVVMSLKGAALNRGAAKFLGYGHSSAISLQEPGQQILYPVTCHLRDLFI